MNDPISPVSAVVVAVAVALLVSVVVEALRRRRMPAVLLSQENPLVALREQRAKDLRMFLAKAQDALERAPFFFDPVAFEVRRAALTEREEIALARVDHAALIAEMGAGFGDDTPRSERIRIVAALHRLGCRIDFDERGW